MSMVPLNSVEQRSNNSNRWGGSNVVRSAHAASVLTAVQGYLAHKKLRLLRTLQ